MKITFFIPLIPIILLASAARADIKEQDSQISSGTYTVLVLGEADLLDGATALSSSGNFQVENSAGVSVLTDGSFGGAVGSGANGYSATGGAPGGTSVTYSLGSNPLGYSLSDIEVYSGWNDNGRYQQGYTIKYSLATTPSTFLTLYTVAPYPAGNPYVQSNHNDGAETMIYSTTGSLMSGVAEIEIDFNSVVNGYTGYREIVVNQVPEPSSVALMLLGGLAGFAFAIRRASRQRA